MATKRKQPTPAATALVGDIRTIILRWGSVAAAITAIVISVSYTLPAAFRYYSSDSAPWEGRLEHGNDLAGKLSPLIQAIQGAADAAGKATKAADLATAQAEAASVKEDIRDLCNLIDRLAAIDMRLAMTPGDQFFIDAKTARQREIEVLRKRIQANGQVPEC